MKRTGRHIRISFLLVVYTALANGQVPVVRFGLITDIQYANFDTRGTRFYRNSLKKLDESIQAFNRANVPFIINLGDITDRNPDDLAPVLKEFGKFKSKIYQTSGNHDYKGIQDNTALYRKLRMPGEYYSFKKGEWRFVMLNTNEVASYSNVTGTWKEPELTQMIQKIKDANGNNAEEYNGGISSRQLKWLQQQLQIAEAGSEKVLIFSHHPFSCADGLTALNDKEVLSLVSKYTCVKALIAGHHHAGAFCEENAIPCIVAEGMVETADQNAYGIIELYPDKLTLTGYGRMTSRTLYFNKKSNMKKKIELKKIWKLSKPAILFSAILAGCSKDVKQTSDAAQQVKPRGATSGPAIVSAHRVNDLIKLDEVKNSRKPMRASLPVQVRVCCMIFSERLISTR